LNKTSSKTLTSFKYAYLLVFFAFLTGLFHPLITGIRLDNVFIGVIVLFIGLAGAVLLYKTATSEPKRLIFIGGGFALIAISLFFILQFTGRA